MITLKGEKIFLRALEPEDLSFIYKIENEETIWEVSNTQTPYSRFLIKQYLENADQDIYQAKQLRLAICELGVYKPVGLIDLFDYDPKNHRAGVGIVIENKKHRNKGLGSEALQILVKYAFSHLQLHQIYANIGCSNEASLKLFTNFGFQKIGVKKDWIFQNGSYQDELLFQLINPNY
ncbi:MULTISPECIES: GNAT family N-acetyltransferase [Flavobacterium]|uniref:N-acetyltransferase n=2 Tax=Flavobacterium TaxID=237 RepID=A0AA94JPC4_9FLAO|nr:MULTISPECIES: GNAT family protein [Flavobacterium]OXA83288.1 GNAT family N-acetyltransferase [Flavobacterium columnare NBRC 100251 = ATCC 23463]AMA49593.1 acetyltransferase [Flavobacterium covae]AND63290.1 acetyltransferase [Flavobacterium covae]MCH4828879.1 GNAT family N-acetyltransferase [Flavobacterium columnare]MCH4832133.1 GNAT family N-acetyltransferase [Flavobacterium columnare]